MSAVRNQSATPRALPPSRANWQRRFFLIVTILGWLAFTAVIGWCLGKIIVPLELIGFSALLAYLIFPLMRFFERSMPHALALLLSLVLVLVVIGVVLYFVVVAAVQELGLLLGIIQNLIGRYENYAPLQATLNQLGISGLQFHLSEQQILSYTQGAIKGIVPLASSIFGTLLSLLIVATLSVYFLLDGTRVTRWLRHKTPLAYQSGITLFLDELGRLLGGYIRGQVLLSAIMAATVGIGAFFIGVPYVFLLMVIVFVAEFIPQIGPYISGAIGILFALTHGWQMALIYTIFVIVMQGGLDGMVLAPRILGNAVGLHPIFSVFALLVGGSLFGLVGALFSAPAAALLQTFVLAFWNTWRERHPEQFPLEEQERASAGGEGHARHDQNAIGGEESHDVH
jgi:predicted PurR-regulated permease PerM